MKITKTAEHGIRDTAAVLVTVTDTGGNFTGTDLETILDELATRPNPATIMWVIDGGGVAITTGSKGFLEVVAGTITAARLVADQSGSIVVDVKKATYSGLPTTASIAASAKPTLSSAQKSQDTTLTGWTTSISAGDWLEFVVDSATTVQRVTLSLTVLKS